MNSVIAMLLIVIFRVSCVAGFVILSLKGHPCMAVLLLLITSMMSANYSIKESNTKDNTDKEWIHEKCGTNTPPTQALEHPSKGNKRI